MGPSLTGRRSQGLVLGLVFFNIFINDLDEQVQGMLVKFAGDTKLDGIANTQEQPGASPWTGPH